MTNNTGALRWRFGYLKDGTPIAAAAVYRNAIHPDQEIEEISSSACNEDRPVLMRGSRRFMIMKDQIMRSVYKTKEERARWVARYYGLALDEYVHLIAKRWLRIKKYTCSDKLEHEKHMTELDGTLKRKYPGFLSLWYFSGEFFVNSAPVPFHKYKKGATWHAGRWINGEHYQEYRPIPESLLSQSSPNIQSHSREIRRGPLHRKSAPQIAGSRRRPSSPATRPTRRERIIARAVEEMGLIQAGEIE